MSAVTIRATVVSDKDLPVHDRPREKGKTAK
jgi:hypothetical protein